MLKAIIVNAPARLLELLDCVTGNEPKPTNALWRRDAAKTASDKPGVVQYGRYDLEVTS